jgi:hypothetical protein
MGSAVDPDRRERLIAGLLLAVGVGFGLVQLVPELTVRVPPLNDGVLHLASLQRTMDALASGQDPTDHWLGTFVMGYPLVHHYQHLPYVLPALVAAPAGMAVAAADLLRAISYLLLSLFPLSIYASMRWFGFSPLPAALAGLVAPLLSTNGLYGLEYGSYVWRGYGLYTQLWGMVLLPMALARTYRAVLDGRGYLWAVVLLAATLLSHVVMGYIALGSAALFVVLGGWRRRSAGATAARPPVRAVRLAALLALVGAVTASFVLPFLGDSDYLNRSVWEPSDKVDSLGHERVLGTLLGGELFDHGRVPVLSILAAAGLVLCAWRWRDERCRVPVALGLAWLALYFGRPTWGPLLDLLPLGRDLQLHRLIAGVHLGGVMLMGLGLALPWSWATARRDPRAVLAVAALTALLLVPAWAERSAYLAQNAQWMEQQRVAMDAEREDLDALVDTLRSLPPGRVYAGLATNWGRDYTVGSVPVYALLNGAGLDTLGYLYHALSLNADVQVLFDDGLPEQYDLFDVRYVVTPTDFSVPASSTVVGDFGRHRLHAVSTTGYFDVVGSEVAYAGDKADWFPAASAWLASEAVANGQHPTVDLGAEPDGATLLPLAGAGPALAGATYEPEPARGRIVSETVSSNAYAATVDVARDSHVLLKATYHPGWRVTVDGAAAQPVMLMPSFLGVPVSPGSHEVRAVYEPPPGHWPLQALAVLTLLATAIVGWRRDRPARPGQANSAA